MISAADLTWAFCTISTSGPLLTQVWYLQFWLPGNHNSSGRWCNPWVSQCRVYFVLLYILFFSVSRNMRAMTCLWSLYMSVLCIVRTVLWEKSRSFYWLAHDRFDSALFHPVIARYICECLCMEIGYHKLVKKVACHAEVNQSSAIVITHILKPMRAHYFSEVVITNFPIKVSDDDLDVSMCRSDCWL